MDKWLVVINYAFRFYRFHVNLKKRSAPIKIIVMKMDQEFLN